MRRVNPTPKLVLVATALLFGSVSAGAANHAVIVGDVGNTMNPTSLTIAVGDTVTFTNVHAGFHNVRSDTVTVFRCAQGCDGAGGNGAPAAVVWTSTVTFPTPGTISFYCEIHGSPTGGMHGTINVQTLPVELQSFNVD